LLLYWRATPTPLPLPGGRGLVVKGPLGRRNAGRARINRIGQQAGRKECGGGVEKQETWESKGGANIDKAVSKTSRQK
jgi:hypothetical protein